MMRIKAVFLVGGRFFGGAERVLVRFLGKQDFLDPYVLLVENNQRLFECLSRAIGTDRVVPLGLSLSIVPKISHFLTMPLDISRIAHRVMASKEWHDFFIKQDIDVFIGNNSVEVMLLGAIAPSAPRVGHVHDMASSFMPAARKALCRACERMDFVITPSRSCMNDLLDHAKIPPQRMGVVYNGVDFAGARQGYEARTDLRRGELLKIGFAGKASHQKGLDILIETLSGLSPDLGPIELKAACTEGEKVIFTRLARENHFKVSTFRALSQEDMPSFYQGVDLMVVPSRRDSLPTVVLESFAAGVPVIGSCVDGIPEMILDDRFLFAPNPVELAKAIRRVVVTPWEILRRGYIENLEFISTRFSDAEKARNMKQVMETILCPFSKGTPAK